MTSSTLILILVLVVSAVALIVYLLTSQIKNLREDIKKDDNQVITEWLKQMKDSMDKLTPSVEEQLKGQRNAIGQQTKMIWERLDVAQEVIRNMQKQIGGIQEFGKDMKDLSNILKSPKLRGGLGEQFLYEILANSLPAELYKTQYKFKDGITCDAIIITDKGMIPIDSKFPMENFKAMATADTQEERDKYKKVFIGDVKKRIDEISSKYILPGEGTTEFAVMYVPSESIYYELLVNTSEIEEYSRRKNVFISSPNTLNYQVKAILVGYQQNELNKHASEILKAISGIKIEAEKFNEDLGVLERHITNSYKGMDLVRGKFDKLFGKIENVQAIGTAEEHKLLGE